VNAPQRGRNSTEDTQQFRRPLFRSGLLVNCLFTCLLFDDLLLFSTACISLPVYPRSWRAGIDQKEPHVCGYGKSHGQNRGVRPGQGDGNEAITINTTKATAIPLRAYMRRPSRFGDWLVSPRPGLTGSSVRCQRVRGGLSESSCCVVRLPRRKAHKTSTLCGPSIPWLSNHRWSAVVMPRMVSPGQSPARNFASA